MSLFQIAVADDGTRRIQCFHRDWDLRGLFPQVLLNSKEKKDKALAALDWAYAIL